MRITLLALAASLASTAAFAGQPNRPLQMIVLFSIKDYASWRPVFDAAAPERARDGVNQGTVYRKADSPNDLLVVFDVTSEKNGRTWMSSPEVHAAWAKGGVIGAPTYRFLK